MEVQREQASAGKRSKKTNVIVTIVVALFVVAAIGGVIAANVMNDKLKWVTIAKPAPDKLNTVKGEIVPSDAQTIYQDSSKGRIQQVFVDEGQVVQKGAQLFQYEQSNIDLQLEKKAVDQKVAEANRDEAQKIIDSLTEQVNRLEADSDKKPGLERTISQQEANKQLADLQLEKIKLDQDQLNKKKQDSIVFSTMDGVVGNIDADRAQYTYTAPGSDKEDAPVMTIYSNSAYQMEGTITEKQKSEMAVNQEVRIKADVVSDHSWKGHILSVSDYPTHQGKKVVYAFKAQLDDSEKLYPGYHVTAKVDLPSQMEITIPRSSVMKKGKTTYVYVAKKGKVQKQEVSVESKDKETYTVLTGLEHGDRYLTNPSSDVHAGMKIKKD
ncbi:efflux RND transporter periplasmic adaptor subunit [Priestia koreensis]|uniref:efflux RND transporter periplasmic adaptor subunit n=1 Tax=Priestia koreensis TaxID=284581 RepID=UPI0030184AE9